MSWNPALYLKFGGERTQPAIDLAARVPLEAPERVVDLGCGPGNSTAVLRRRWPAAEIVGVDNSAEMIAAATASDPSIRWERDDIAQWCPSRPFDVVFSNAALQWLPDHARLLPRLMTHVAAGGVLAIQVPAHVDSPVHRRIVEISRVARWTSRLDAARNALTMHRPAFYYDVLRPTAAQIDLWETEYDHVLGGPNEIVEWIRGTGLRPFLDALETEDDRAAFLERLRADVARDYSPLCDGNVLFPFRRLFLVARR